uniref:Putative secreted peptide n=1 Tax=Anopheles braziliensis TaxID=58242 RepID=A0A2M3ZQ28_9DIPT
MVTLSYAILASAAGWWIPMPVLVRPDVPHIWPRNASIRPKRCTTFGPMFGRWALRWSSWPPVCFRTGDV